MKGKMTRRLRVLGVYESFSLHEVSKTGLYHLKIINSMIDIFYGRLWGDGIELKNPEIITRIIYKYGR